MATVKNKIILYNNNCIFDWFLANLLVEYDIKCSSEKIVDNDRFETTIT